MRRPSFVPPLAAAAPGRGLRSSPGTCAPMGPRRSPFHGVPTRRAPQLHTRRHRHRQQQQQQQQRLTVRAFEEGAGSGGDEVEIELRDEATGRTLACGIEHAIQHDGITYVLCYTMDEIVGLACAEDGEVRMVENADLVDKLFERAAEEMAQQNILLVNSAYVLTADDRREDVDDEDDDVGERGEEEEEEDQDAVEVMGEFREMGKEWLIVKPVIPPSVMAKEVETGYVLVQDEELKRISPLMEAHIESVSKL